MKAVVIHAAKDLRIEEHEPEAPGPGQVEVAVEAGGICGSDLHYYNHGGFGAIRLREPMILGHEVAGYAGFLSEGRDTGGARHGGGGLVSRARRQSESAHDGKQETTIGRGLFLLR